MDDVGFLQRAPSSAVRTVRLRKSQGELVLVHGDGTEDRIPVRQLYRAFDQGPELHLGRRGDRRWRLRTSGAAAGALRDVIPRKWRRIQWGAARFWHVMIFVTSVLVVELVKMPSDWIAPLVPESLESRLAPADVRDRYGSYCTSPEGEAAIRGLIRRLDPQVAERVKVQVLNEGRFLMSALPGDRLVIYKSFLVEAEPDEFAALLAHEVAHLKRRDAVEATLRGNGTFGAFVGTMIRSDASQPTLDFSAEQETAADLDAVAMLMRANISPLPGAALFDRMEQARQRNEYYGKEQYYLHYGLYPDRARRWRDMPEKMFLRDDRPAFRPAEEDALFNYCWRHTGPPRNPYPAPPK